MDPRTQERVEQWDSRPFSGGYAELSTLAESGFSGAVSAGGAWLFVLNGRVVGVFDGTIEDFADASGTVYQAPHPSLPLLCSMEERGGETRAKYYTNETPLEEVDETLTNGSFTGYVELSENVLSGDYYAVYYGGRRMAAAYIGNAERLLTGDEAFERAANEVGIYEVIDVDIDVTDVPESDDGGRESGSSDDTAADVDTATGLESTTDGVEPIDISGASGGADDGPGGGITADDTDVAADDTDITAGGSDVAATEPSGGITADDPTDGTTADGTTPDESPGGITAADPAGGGATDEPTPGDSDPMGITGTTAATESTDDDRPERRSSAAAGDETAAPSPAGDRTDEAGGGRESGSGLDPAEVEAAAAELEESNISWTDDADERADDSARTDASSGSGPSSGDGTRSSGEPSRTDAEAGSDATPTDGTAEGGEDHPESGLEERFAEEEQWRETRNIPSIDPERTAEAAESDRAAPQSGGGRSSSSRGRTQTGQRATSAAARGGGAETATADRSAASESTQSRPDHPIDRLKQRVERLEGRREELVSKAQRLESERDELDAENQELSATVERLESRIDDLEEQLERAQGAGGATASTSAARSLSPEQALAGTNLFVRYGSKSRPTLETAHGGEADRDEVASNLRIEHHTEFDAADVAVAGQPYAEYLTSSMAYRFVDWLTEVLLYEIRDTGHADGLGDLYDAIPRIDRAELRSSISLADDDTADVPDEVTFDVVAYDKRGNPLVLVTLNDSREPATEEMLADLEAAASAVKANYPDLAAAMAVTSSYFDPGALEVTEQATSSGLLSRGSKSSFVNLSRKQGYHLCLVESRSEGFHMTVPEL